MDEVRFAFRRLWKRPASTLASVGTLACAIGAAAVTWSVLSAVLLDPLPIRDADGVAVVGYQAGTSRTQTGFPYPALRQIRDSGIFAGTAAHWSSPHALLVTGGPAPVRADVAFATHDFFDVLGVPAARGREFLEEDDRRGAPPVAVLTDRYWRNAFQADPAIVGRLIEIDGTQVTIAGVLRRGFRGIDLARKPDIYLPFHTLADFGNPLTNYFADTRHPSSPTSATVIIGRLKPATTAAESEGRLAALALGIGARARPVLVPAATAAVPAAARDGMRRFSTMLAATVALLLLIGCTTVGMLLLIRTEARRAEFAMCLALGAGRGHLARGVAVEGALLAAAGALAALPVAWWMFKALLTFELPGQIALDLLELSLDRRVLLACLASALGAVLIIASIAAVFAFRADVAEALRTRGGATGRTGRTTRTALVAAQVGVAVMLIVGAGLFTRSLMAAFRLNPGVDMSRVVTGSINLGQHGYSAQDAARLFDALAGTLKRQPAIEAVTLHRSYGGMAGGDIAIDGRPRRFSSYVDYVRVDPGYFNAMGIRITEGRGFSADDRSGAPPVAIVSESLARILATDGAAIGRQIAGHASNDPAPQVVGVASDLITRVTMLEPLVIYVPSPQLRAAVVTDVTVRIAGEPENAKRDVLGALRALDARVTPWSLLTLEERLAAQMAPQRLGGTVLGALGTLALLLTLLGTYAVADSLATSRMREMGIRAALGAQRRQLAAIVLAETARLVTAGIGAGLLLSWAAMTSIRAFLFQVQPMDPVTLTAVAGGMLALALLVTGRAAVRVANVAPSAVLRAE